MRITLEPSHDCLRSIAEASPDAIAIYVDGKCVYANPQALALYEMTKDALERVDAMDLVQSDRRADVVDFVERVRSGAPVAPFITRHTLKNGERKDLESSARIMSIEGKEAILTVTRDITERERLQAEVLKQDRLASLGVLAAGVAHELNNPLMAMSLIVKRLQGAARDNAPGRDLVGDLDQVDDAVKRMSEIIGGLLFLARPGDQPHAHVDVAKVIESSVALLRAGVPRCPAIEVDIGDLPPVNGVPSKLGQAFVNVLRNALQACGPDGRVSVSARATGGEVVIVVEDDGCGIPEDVLPRLMTPFFTTKEGGTGLGLWITQGIVQSHRGRIEVSSRLGSGTKVSLFLPA